MIRGIRLNMEGVLKADSRRKEQRNVKENETVENRTEKH